jgi:Uma2 family endonuclease
VTARAARPPVTPDDLLTMPDGDAYELIDGRLRMMEMSAQSSGLGAVVSLLVGLHVRTNRVGRMVGSDASFRCFPDDADKVRRPDVAYLSHARLSLEQYRAPGHLAVCPELVIEVISPNDLADDVDRKIQDWLAAGATAVWSVHPAVQQVFIHRADGSVDVVGPGGVVTAEDILPGFRMSVDDVFLDQ